MTQQYQQTNINNPEGGVTIANTVASPNAQLTSSDVGKVVRFDTTLAVGAITLPSAVESGDGAEITIIMLAGAVNAATISPFAGDSITAPAGAPANPAITNSASFILRSNGPGRIWFIVSGLA